jgi:hypothetical protein
MENQSQVEGFIIELDPDTNVQIASRVDIFEPRQIVSSANDMSLDTETIPIEEDDIEFEETLENETFTFNENLRNILEIINPIEHADIFTITTSQAQAHDMFMERLMNVPPPIAPLGKSDNILDSFTGAPLPQSAKTIALEENEFYEVDSLTNFFLSMQETRNPLSGVKLTEKQFEQLADTQLPSSKERLMHLFASSKSQAVKPLSFVKAKYFEDCIYGMILQCLVLCELDEVYDVHVSIQEFNKRYFPTIIRSMSGLSLTNPTKLLKTCKNVTDQINAVLSAVNTKDDNEFAEEYIYHPVVLRSVSYAILSICTLSSTQYYSALSAAKFSAKICEVPIARIVQKNVRQVTQ